MSVSYGRKESNMIEYLMIEGKKYPISVGYYALKHTSAEVEANKGVKLSMEDILGGDITYLEPLLYHSLVAGARKENETLDIDRDEVEFLLDDVLWDFMEIIPRFFPQKNLKGSEKKAPTKKK
jgi:hypothetical protein